MIRIISEELKTNQNGLKMHFIRETRLQDSLMSSILRNDSFQIDLMKGYFENLRVFVKITLKQSTEAEKSLMKDMVVRNLRSAAKEVRLSQIDKCYFLFSLKYWKFDGFLVPSTEIFVEHIFKKIDRDSLKNYTSRQFIDLFYNFFVSMLNFWNGMPINNELFEIFENTIDAFVDNTRKHFSNSDIKNEIMKCASIDERSYFRLWILILIVK